MSKCIKCGRQLTNDDIGFHKKMVNRGATEFMCVECLSNYFGIETEKAYKMIEHLRISGCTLFV